MAEGKTALPPLALLALAKRVERAVGRVPGRRWGPRVVDVDLLLYDDWQVREREPWLEIPHPELWRRQFVLVPLRDLRPDLAAPDGTPIDEWLGALSATSDESVQPYGPPPRAPAPPSDFLV